MSEAPTSGPAVSTWTPDGEVSPKPTEDAVLSAIEGGLRQGRDVRLAGFGTFAPSVRKATTGRNPRTGARIAVGATCSVRFRPGKALREAVSLYAGMGG